MRTILLSILFFGAAADFKTEDGITLKTNAKPVEWNDGHTTIVKHDYYKDTYQTVYLSHPVTLMKGEAWFSLPDVTVLPMPNPGVPYAIIGMQYDIVDQTNRSVPLSELYMHHWLVYDTVTTGTGFNIGCGGAGTFVSNVYGAGAEMRGIDYKYELGYGYVSTTGHQAWSANLHFINTLDLSTDYFNGSHGAATKSCIECDYAPNKAPFCEPGLDSGDIFRCCVADARCPTNNPKDHSKINYYLKTNLTWTTDISKVKHIRMFVIDGVPCSTLMNVYPHKHGPGTDCEDKFCKTVVTRQMPVSGTLMWAYDHQHEGAVNGSLAVNHNHVCSSYPHIGTDPHHAPGNELGYLTGFTLCVDPAYPKQNIHVNKGDNLTLTAFYNVDPLDNTSYPLPGGKHTGIMNLFYFFLAEDEPEVLYNCKNNQCVKSATSGGAPLDVCKSACGPSPIFT